VIVSASECASSAASAALCLVVRASIAESISFCSATRQRLCSLVPLVRLERTLR
jgi:hypothetical protein